MAELTVNVREKSRPVVDIIWRDRQGNVEDITGKQFKFSIKPTAASPDSTVMFDLAGTIPLGTDGKVRLTMTLAHTAFKPGTYYGSLRRWDAADPLTDPPRDARSADYVIAAASKITE